LDPKNLVDWRDLGLGKMRRVGEFLGMAAMVHHSVGDEAAAMKDLDQMERVAQVAAGGHLLIHHLVEMAIRGEAEAKWLQIAPDLQLKSEKWPQGLEREAWVEEIDRHADGRVAIEGVKDALVGERVYMLASEEAAEKRLPHLAPMLRLDVARACEKYEGMIDAVASETGYWPVKAAGEWPEYQTNVMYLAHSIEEEQNIAGHRLIVLCYRHACIGEAVGIRLALRLYEVEHGFLPASVMRLMPEYLKSLPRDPFRKDNVAWEYSREKREFWSVNEDGVDDGGDGMAAAPGKPVDWRGKDACFGLDRVVEVPATGAATRE
jgi:hypothetical protein